MRKAKEQEIGTEGYLICPLPLGKRFGEETKEALSKDKESGLCLKLGNSLDSVDPSLLPMV